jgi:hypothetical protein
MDTEYVLSYTGSEIEERLGMVDGMVKSVNGQTPDENGNVNVEGGSGGMNTTAVNLLVTILRNAVYGTDQSANITALANALTSNGGGEEPDIPDEPDIPEPITYTITNEMVNVTSSNMAASVTEGASYTATLTAADGYEISSVTVTMGGVDVTADVYADSVISIPAVTGNVEIVASAVEMQTEPELITDGLMAYFDFRTAAYDNAGSGGSTLITPTQGNGHLFTWANNAVTAQDEHGIISGRTLMYSSSASKTLTECGESFTWVFKSYHTGSKSPGFSKDYASLSNTMKIKYSPKYKTASSTANVSAEGLGSRLSDAYELLFLVVDGSVCKLYFEDTLVKTVDGSSIDGFVNWLSTLNMSTCLTGESLGYICQLAIYNKALSGVQITEMAEYLATLEVTA